MNNSPSVSASYLLPGLLASMSSGPLVPGTENVAPTLWFADITTTQVAAAPEQAPLQPEKTLPAAAAAVRVTEALVVNVAEQVAPQLMPAGLLVTVPAPVPAKLTVSNEVGLATVEKVAVALFDASISTTHVPVPEHAPDQPLNVKPEPAVAMRVTLLPEVNVAEHVAPQLIPAGLLVTVLLPAPAPALITVSE